MQIELVLAPNPGPMTLTGTNTWLLVSDAAEVAVIDPGPDIPEHIDAVFERATAMGRVSTVLVTHRHGDHLPAAKPLCERTGATLLGHPDLPGVQRGVADNEAVFGAVRALATPGHTRESMCFWHPGDGTVFTGDLVAGTGTVIVDDTPGALAAYVASLERLLTLAPRVIYPGHGPVVPDAMAKLREYVAHRRMREQQVVAALSDNGASTIDSLVSRIYPEVAPNLQPMAARNVRACLDKLESESRVRADGAAWTLIG